MTLDLSPVNLAFSAGVILAFLAAVTWLVPVLDKLFGVNEPLEASHPPKAAINEGKVDVTEADDQLEAVITKEMTAVQRRMEELRSVGHIISRDLELRSEESLDLSMKNPEIHRLLKEWLERQPDLRAKLADKFKERRPGSRRLDLTPREGEN